MQSEKKKRPHTLKKRIRSWLWDFLLEDGWPDKPVQLTIDGHAIQQSLKKSGLLTKHDI